MLSIRKLNLTACGSRSIAKGRNIDGYKGISRKKLEDVLSKKSTLPARRIKKYIHKTASIKQEPLN